MIETTRLDWLLLQRSLRAFTNSEGLCSLGRMDEGTAYDLLEPLDATTT
jgi:hypothetical protein